MNVLITGANGFIGKVLCDTLTDSGYQVRGSVRDTIQKMVLPSGVEGIIVGDMEQDTDWFEAIDGVDVVVHLAARVHVMDDLAADPLAEFRRVNTAGSLNLARQAADAGVKRFIFISSIKVNGERTGEERLENKGKEGFSQRRKDAKVRVKGNEESLFFSEEDVPCPQDAYAVSKMEAEAGLWKIADKSGMEIVIIRPPLVYGPGVKANFQLMMKWVKRGVPLPLGAVHNRRSFVALDNLVSFIILCMNHPGAVNEMFLISDGEDVSTTELLQKMAIALGKRSFLLPVPVALMSFVAGLLGKKDVTDRLFGSLQVDISKAKELLAWKPVVSMYEGLSSCVKTLKIKCRDL